MEAALSHLGSGALVLFFTSPKIEDFGGGRVGVLFRRYFLFLALVFTQTPPPPNLPELLRNSREEFGNLQDVRCT